MALPREKPDLPALTSHLLVQDLCWRGSAVPIGLGCAAPPEYHPLRNLRGDEAWEPAR